MNTTVTYLRGQISNQQRPPVFVSNRSSSLLPVKFKKLTLHHMVQGSNSFELLTRSVHLKTGNKQWVVWKRILKAFTININSFVFCVD
jgi:hypothetical protein